MKSIDNGYPMLLKVSNPTGGAHVIIVKGYKENRDGINVIYNDPLDGEEHMVDFIMQALWAIQLSTHCMQILNQRCKRERR
jgi:hypothetical protein